uniref:Uncharacterized protein n=1 Tax=Phaselicystis flava TaxID=525924 RepID=A0A3S7V099_9BACT|nr:hypothetical protein [Phaselicystis flava]
MVKEKEPDAAMAWPSAQTVQKHAKVLAPCRASVEDAAGARADAAPVWDGIAKAADVADPGADTKAQLDAARALLKAVGSAPIDKVQKATVDAEAALKKASEAALAKAETATVREALPKGVLDRGLALGIGVGLSAITLILSYLSVRVASTRRMATLVPLREAARMGQPGAHAAAVLKLAAQHNGGQPGMVIGAAVGGLVAAALARLDSDFFIVGVMAGCIAGLGFQWIFRLAGGAGRWRARASELADVEKPAIPIVLVLSGVNAGLEAPFIKFFNGLSDHDAALTVEKLAAQAEERILAAADAGAAARQMQPQQPY